MLLQASERAAASRPSNRRGRPPVPDVEIAHQVIAVVADARRPLGVAELRRRVTGRAVRVDHVVRTLVVAGRLRQVGRAGFVLNRGVPRDAA